MRIVAATILLILSVSAIAQKQGARAFRLAPGAKYAPGNVLVKVKPKYKEQVAQLVAGQTARIKDVSLRSVGHLVKPQLARQGALLRGPRHTKNEIDISRYFAIRFDPGLDMEDFINRLYATGYFEIIEPEYENTVNFSPNDPLASSQYYLTVTKANRAWDITQGDTTMTIAIVDSGVQLNHPDIAPNLYRNWAEFPPNGVDDDGNGYIDDYQGWDFVGPSVDNIPNNIVEDNNPSVTHGGLASHGTWVAGCAAAAGNNSQGIAGIAFNAQILFTKHSADDQDPNVGSVYFGYSGVLYAANLGIKIINLSWGGTNRSQIAQDVITHVTVDLGALVIAAAGNSANANAFYPAAYEHVLSVAATDLNNKAASFTNFGTTVDLSAPGVNIETTGFGSIYEPVNGTSFSAPITSGAAALVWGHFPEYTAAQVAEQIRVSSDGPTLYAANTAVLTNLLGKGRLDVERALINESPSVRATKPKLVLVDSVTGKSLLSFDFTNYLHSTTAGLQITISGGGGVSYQKPTIQPGLLPTGTTFSNELNPFELTINPIIGENKVIPILIQYSDGSYTDFEFVNLVVYPSFIDVNINEVLTTVTNIGRIGYQSPSTSTLGSGFVFDDQNLLFEMGIIIKGSSTLYNNVRGVDDGFDQDFVSVKKIRSNSPGKRSDFEVSGAFSNSSIPATQALVVNYTSLVWRDSPRERFVVLEYKIRNPSANTLSDFHFGIFADWDVTTNDAAEWFDPLKLGYVHSTDLPSAPYAGIQLLKGTPSYFAIENDQDYPGNPFGLYDDFTDSEKIQTLTTSRLSAGVGAGTDVSHVVSSGPHTIGPGEEITIAFALHGSLNLDDLKSSALWADSVYNYTLQATQPAVDSVEVCYGSPATLTANGPSVIKWYQTFTGGSSFFTGDQFTTGNLFGDTTLYVSNGEESFESVRTPLVVTAKANPTIVAAGGTTICEGNVITLSVASADFILWSNGAETATISVSEAGDYSVTVKDNTLLCESTSGNTEVFVNEAPEADFTIDGNLYELHPQSFHDASTGATSWSWDFGDGEGSEQQEPEHTFDMTTNYSVTLTVTNDAGCSDSKTVAISVISGLDEPGGNELTVYPNPSIGPSLYLHAPGGSNQLCLINSLGQVVLDQALVEGSHDAGWTISVAALPPGMYILRVKGGDKVMTRKVMKGD